jgi:hypothetical protein
MGAGIVVGGIILLIIGVGAYSYLGSLPEQGVAANMNCSISTECFTDNGNGSDHIY